MGLQLWNTFSLVAKEIKVHYLYCYSVNQNIFVAVMLTIATKVNPWLMGS